MRKHLRAVTPLHHARQIASAMRALFSSAIVPARHAMNPFEDSPR
jgi:hypothetical protein